MSTKKDLEAWLAQMKESGITFGMIPGAWEPWKESQTMNVAQAAERLGVSKETVYRLCREGILPHTRVGTRITISPDQLKEYQTRPLPTGKYRHL